MKRGCLGSCDFALCVLAVSSDWDGWSLSSHLGKWRLFKTQLDCLLPTKPPGPSRALRCFLVPWGKSPSVGSLS